MSGYYTVPVTVTDSAGKTATTTATATLNDTRFGAAVPVTATAKTYSAAIAGFEALVGQPLACYRIENLKSPIASSMEAYGELTAAPPGCRLLIDLHPATDGSDDAAITSLLASLKAAGFTSTRVSVYHELGPFTSPAPFISVFQSTADLIHAAGFQSVYVVDSYQIAVSGFLEPYYPGDSYVDLIYPDLYAGNGLAAFPLVASFADEHGKVLGLCETGCQANRPASANYGTPAQNIAFLDSLFGSYADRLDSGIPVGDLSWWQGVLSDGSDFTLATNAYAIPVWQKWHGVFNTSGELAA